MGFSQHRLTTTYTQELASYIAQLRYEDIPQEVLTRLKNVMIHTLANALAASKKPEADKVIDFITECNTGNGGEAAAWVNGKSYSLENTCLVNSILADFAIDAQDLSAAGHAACGIVSTAFAVAQAEHRSGREFLCAMAAGYEVYCRIVKAVAPTEEDKKERGIGAASWQLFGAIVPALKLMGLDELQINRGLGMATTCTPIPASFHVTCDSDLYHYEYAVRSQTAVTLARCAKLGVENLEDGFDDFAAFGTLMTSAHTPEWYTKQLKERSLLLELAYEGSAEQEEAFFMQCAKEVLTEERARAFCKALQEIEACEDLAALSGYFADRCE